MGETRRLFLLARFLPFPPVRLADVSLVGIGKRELSHGPTRIDYTEGPDPVSKRIARFTPRPAKKDLNHTDPTVR